MEKLDVYNINGEKTGKTIIRDNEQIMSLKDDEFIAVGGVLLINSKGQILLSRRSKNKRFNPGLWELNGGCYLAGEKGREAITREVKEEVGIDLKPTEGVLIRKTKSMKFLRDLWAFKIEVDVSDLQFPDGEVEDAKWASIDELISLREDGKMVDSNEVTKQDYANALRELKIIL